MSQAHQISPLRVEAEPGVLELEVLVLPDDGAQVIEASGTEVIDEAPLSANDNAARGDREPLRDRMERGAGSTTPFADTLPRVSLS